MPRGPDVASRVPPLAGGELFPPRREDVPCVLVGVGAAFDVLAGHSKRAPEWMQSSGLEWAFRLAHEPRRLWRRYLIGNPRFAALFIHQLLARIVDRRMRDPIVRREGTR